MHASTRVCMGRRNFAQNVCLCDQLHSTGTCSAIRSIHCILLDSQRGPKVVIYMYVTRPKGKPENDGDSFSPLLRTVIT